MTLAEYIKNVFEPSNASCITDYQCAEVYINYLRATMTPANYRLVGAEKLSTQLYFYCKPSEPLPPMLQPYAEEVKKYISIPSTMTCPHCGKIINL